MAISPARASSVVFFASPVGIPPFRGYSIDGEFVWGATAAMVRALAAVIVQVAESEERSL